jgi:hypothetical protein
MTQPAVDPFDAALAASPTIVVALSRIVDPLGRRPHDVPRIERYRRDMLAGARFPPISVVTWGSRYLVADGHKRLAAYAGLGRPEVRVELWTWGRWARDQGRQVKDNSAKNVQILRLGVTNPPAALRLVRSTLAHWRRVAAALAATLRTRTGA